ncbi:D-alanyl-D-alanine carboxypeptidase family protein [Rhodobacter ferrooxidans]|uniref:Serine-type D-Ala-D-Ala carboxypeptidase n=1 Tax=Rhodobacter ferrooxidans TaxID=371731 RepID=C8RWM0_9RHOB|nr:D-alanyl-D-alanine carboxypeptidase family protein [Rhodobacter sp. SW2]EEW26963.1 Serine-type D-Ala-D-Ala carboxypeptidase [Rhodobacter sp. SW2]
MASLIGQFVRNLLLTSFVLVCAFVSPAGAAPYAAIVIDARTGETIYAKNADTRLHPASLTKMLTLYITFGAIERGEISLDTMVTVSKHAASEPPSRLGLRAGQKIALRYLIRAAAIKSANDAATAIGEAVGGSEAKFAERMNRTAKALGMRNSTFRNANGLTTPGHMSTARDMTTLGRHLFYDFPQYYNIFSRRSSDAGVAEVANTNRRFLDMYEGADGIKTGYTAPAGFNLTASAQRGNKRIIATIFGGTSTAMRNAKMAELLDLGFASAPANAAVQAPAAPGYQADPAEAPDEELLADADAVAAGKTLRIVTTVSNSPRPRGRPAPAAAAAEVAVAAMQDDIAGALAEAASAPAEAVDQAAAVVPVAEMAETAPPAPVAEQAAPEMQVADAEVAQAPLPFQLLTAEEAGAEATNIVSLSSAGATTPRPAAKPVQLAATIIHTATPLDGTTEVAAIPSEPEVVTRISTSGGRHWGVNVGRFASSAAAERAMFKIALSESATLNDGRRKIVQKSGGFDANFMGLSQDQADLACRRLQARGTQCFTIGP